MKTAIVSFSLLKVDSRRFNAKESRDCSLFSDIAAHPHSINTLDPNATDDVRTPDKLIDGENDDIDGKHSWIAPILPNLVRRTEFFLVDIDRDSIKQVVLFLFSLGHEFTPRSNAIVRAYVENETFCVFEK